MNKENDTKWCVSIYDMIRDHKIIFLFDIKLTGGVGKGVGFAVVGGLVGTGADVGCRFYK